MTKKILFPISVDEDTRDKLKARIAKETSGRSSLSTVTKEFWMIYLGGKVKIDDLLEHLRRVF